MPTKDVILNRREHLKLTFKPLPDFSFAREMPTMPLLMMEVPLAATVYPIIFAEPSGATPYALLGLEGHNVFIDAANNWKAPYLPLMASNYPFSLGRIEEKQEGKTAREEAAVAIDINAPQFRQSDGKPLYDEEGNPTQILKHVNDMLSGQYGLYLSSQDLLRELAESGVLEEKTVRARGHLGDCNVDGLRIASREKVMSLPDATLARWAKNGILEMLFAHWQSFRNLDHLVNVMQRVSAKTGQA